MTAINNESLANFAGNLAYRLKLLAKTRRATDRMLATRFNVFDYIDPDENLLSDVIADLLDINGKHGQEDVFLKEFLKTMSERDFPSWNFCGIHRENSTSLIENTRRRMDVLVNLGTLGAAIENKPWAKEQKDQISDYVMHLERQFAGNFFILYLSPNGGKPTSLSEELADKLLKENKLVLAAYRGLFSKWLRKCHQQCAAEKIRWFLIDFINYVDQTFALAKDNLTENENE